MCMKSWHPRPTSSFAKNIPGSWQDEDRDEQQEMEHKLQLVVNGP